jgi:hypothetical protein
MRPSSNRIHANLPSATDLLPPHLPVLGTHLSRLIQSDRPSMSLRTLDSLGNGTAPAVPLRSRFIVLVLYPLLVSPVVLFPLRLHPSRPCRPQPQLASSTLGIPAFSTLFFSASYMPLLFLRTLPRVRIRNSIAHSAATLLREVALSLGTRAVDVTTLLHASVPRVLSRNSLATLAHDLSPLRFSSVI